MPQFGCKSLPVIVLAQSGRFIAEQLAALGYRVFVADCFGDTDTLAAASCYHKIPPIDTRYCQEIVNILSKLSNNKPCTLIYGSGIERAYPLLNILPDHIMPIGNTACTIKLLKTPPLFFQLLSTLTIPYPTTQFTPPAKGNWLAKKAGGMGGDHIRYLTDDLDSAAYYFQAYIAGKSGSALFLANGKQAQVISINKQQTTKSDAMPLRLSTISTPWHLAKHLIKQITSIITTLTCHANLIGLNSIDFIVEGKDKLLVLEINPRPSASAELINANTPLLKQHIDACQGILPTNANYKQHKPVALHYLFASKKITIPANMAWHPSCHDLPQAGTTINQNSPICTIVINERVKKLSFDAIISKINQSLYKTITKNPT